jgi:hypothetical protein
MLAVFRYIRYKGIKQHDLSDYKGGRKMNCPICGCIMITDGNMMVESVDTRDGTETTLCCAYRCRDAECESFTEGYIWTFNGESFIMHQMERELEAA